MKREKKIVIDLKIIWYNLSSQNGRDVGKGEGVGGESDNNKLKKKSIIALSFVITIGIE